MPKVADILTALEVRALRKSAPGLKAVGGVPGLYLRVVNPNSTQWVMRVVCSACDKRHDIGLGAYPLIDLRVARDDARSIHLQMREGACVVSQRAQARVEKRPVVPFGQAATEYHETKAKEFKNAKHAAQWISSLREYAKSIWGKSVAAVDREDVLAILKPIWDTKTETATRVRQRIQKVLAYASAAGYRSETAENPARWEGGLEMLLPMASKLKNVKHHAALPYADMPAFMQRLRAKSAASAKALEFAILTAARSGEVRLATWSEIDLAKNLWTVPAAHMKAKKEHRVPLSAAAVSLLATLDKGDGDALLFPGGDGKPMSDMTLSKLLKGMSVPAVPHGFRSTFKTWCQEVPGPRYTDESSELALAHVNDDKTRAAYARGMLLDERRKLMAEWADYVGKINEA